MNLACLALGSLLLAPQPLAAASVDAGQKSGEVRRRPPMLLGETNAEAILRNRGKFRDNLAKVALSDDLKARWKAVRRPFTLVAVFGSWCGDSHRQLPTLLALEAVSNPFIEVHYIGVARNLAVGTWPKGCKPQKVVRVPTFFLFATQPGGGLNPVGTVVETPPIKGQTMAEALVELVESRSH